MTRLTRFDPAVVFVIVAAAAEEEEEEEGRGEVMAVLQGSVVASVAVYS